MKLCIDCKYCAPRMARREVTTGWRRFIGAFENYSDYQFAKCLNPLADPEAACERLIAGETYKPGGKYCSLQRQEQREYGPKSCGTDAIWFEPKQAAQDTAASEREERR